MNNQQTFSIAVFDGDGIGKEITPPCLDLLQLACELASDDESAVSLDFQALQAGAGTYQETGESLPEASVAAARAADAVLLSAMGDPAVRYPDGTEITPQIELRFRLGLYAGIRPVRAIPGVPVPLADPRARDIDFVLVRESIEGLFAPDRKGTRVDGVEATETLLITREVSEKLFKHVFALASRRKSEGSSGRVTCIDKANVFGAFAFFREIFYELAEQHGDDALTMEHAYVDAMAMHMVNQPWNFDVMVTENMFGDILSDLGAAIMGGMGYAPSADIGDDHAVFQPCHGTAPDIVGKGLANPVAMFLSGAMMLDWLGRRQNCQAALKAGALISESVDAAFESGNLRTCELGGDSGLNEVTAAVTAQIKQR